MTSDPPETTRVIDRPRSESLRRAQCGVLITWTNDDEETKSTAHTGCSRPSDRLLVQYEWTSCVTDGQRYSSAPFGDRSQSFARPPESAGDRHMKSTVYRRRPSLN